MKAINDALMDVLVGDAIAVQNMTVFPLLGGKASRLAYLTLDEALDKGLAEVAEISEGGSVPELRFVNRGEVDVLLVDGEELVGAKQNRVLNLSILVGAGHTVSIPVSCVEHGRWQYRLKRFSSGKKNLYARARARKMDAVTFSLRERESRQSNQGQIWDDIAAKSERMAAECPTGAMDAMYEQHNDRLQGFKQTIRPVDGQRGAVFLINGKVAGLELFDKAETFAALMEKLVESFAMDAVEEVNETMTPNAKVVAEFMDRLKAAEVTEHMAVDLGTDFRLTGGNTTGGALVVDGEVVHLSAFNLAEDTIH